MKGWCDETSWQSKGLELLHELSLQRLAILGGHVWRNTAEHGDDVSGGLSLSLVPISPSAA